MLEQVERLCIPEKLIRSNYYSDTYRTHLSLGTEKKECDICKISIPFEPEKEKLLMERFGLPKEDLVSFYRQFSLCINNENKIINKLRPKKSDAPEDAEENSILEKLQNSIITYHSTFYHKTDDGHYHFYRISDPYDCITKSNYLKDNQTSLLAVLQLGTKLLQITKQLSLVGIHLGPIDLDTVYLSKDQEKPMFNIGSLLYAQIEGNEPLKMPITLPKSAHPSLKEGHSQKEETDVYSICATLWAILGEQHYNDLPELSITPKHASEELVELLQKGLSCEPGVTKSITKGLYNLMVPIKKEEVDNEFFKYGQPHQKDSLNIPLIASGNAALPKKNTDENLPPQKDIEKNQEESSLPTNEQTNKETKEHNNKEVNQQDNKIISEQNDNDKTQKLELPKKVLETPTEEKAIKELKNDDYIEESFVIPPIIEAKSEKVVPKEQPKPTVSQTPAPGTMPSKASGTEGRKFNPNKKQSNPSTNKKTPRKPKPKAKKKLDIKKFMVPGILAAILLVVIAGRFLAASDPLDKKKEPETEVSSRYEDSISNDSEEDTLSEEEPEKDDIKEENSKDETSTPSSSTYSSDSNNNSSSSSNTNSNNSSNNTNNSSTPATTTSTRYSRSPAAPVVTNNTSSQSSQSSTSQPTTTSRYSSGSTPATTTTTNNVIQTQPQIVDTKPKKQPLNTLSVSPDNVAIQQGQSIEIKPTMTCSFSSSDSSVAVVQNNKIVAKGPGTCKITARGTNGQTFTINVIIK